MVVMPDPFDEEAIPLGKKITIAEGLEAQLARIVRSEQPDASAGGDGFLVSASKEERGIIFFFKGGYLGHHSLPSELWSKDFPELLENDYVAQIVREYLIYPQNIYK